MKKRKQNIFTDRVNDLLAKEGSSSELFKNIYWICGTEDKLIILSYLEENQEKILKEQQKKLRKIFELQLNQINIYLRTILQKWIQIVPKHVK
ncbi:unnamed protein product [Paramecium primaurelia]|uniref:Uncharacterized protein n=1 Tax=Paramecium primaurelia TaxID=5886 RepID=A0A8S1NZB2_PARPR|nr:unnamed protein product [Paramecium primaurelia]